MNQVRLTGGCQCGALRYALRAMPDRPCICDCRMCQKQCGSFFGAYAGVHLDDFELTRGEISYFRSSDETDRGFRAKCGTPLDVDRPRIGVTIGSLDEPAKIEPIVFYGGEGRVPWLAAAVSREATMTGCNEAAAWSARIVKTNRQHPDHDTETWPPV